VAPAIHLYGLPAASIPCHPLRTDRARVIRGLRAEVEGKPIIDARNFVPLQAVQVFADWMERKLSGDGLDGLSGNFFRHHNVLPLHPRCSADIVIVAPGKRHWALIPGWRCLRLDLQDALVEMQDTLPFWCIFKRH